MRQHDRVSHFLAPGLRSLVVIAHFLDVVGVDACYICTLLVETPKCFFLKEMHI